MAATDYSIESKTTREIRENRQKTAERYSTMTNEELLAEHREAVRRMVARGIEVKDPRTESRT